jgi:hypothetical protein
LLDFPFKIVCWAKKSTCALFFLKSVHTYVQLSVRPSINMYVQMYLGLSFCLSVCMYVCPSVCPSVCTKQYFLPAVSATLQCSNAHHWLKKETLPTAGHMISAEIYLMWHYFILRKWKSINMLNITSLLLVKLLMLLFEPHNFSSW